MPKKQEKTTAAARKVQDGSSALGLAAAISALKLSPTDRKKMPKKGRPDKGAKVEKQPENYDEDLGTPAEFSDDSGDGTINWEELKGEPASKKGPKKKADKPCKQKKHEKGEKKKPAKAKAKALCKKGDEANEEEGEKKKKKKKSCMESFLAKTWLAYRDEQLKLMADDHPSMKYQEKLKLIAQRPKTIINKDSPKD